MWVCLCVSMWVSRRPATFSIRICAAASGLDLGGADATSEQAAQERREIGWKAAGLPIHERRNLARREHGSPSTSTTWQPTPSDGVARAMWMASGVAPARAIRVALVSTPAWCSSAMARFTPGGQAEVVRIDDETAHRVRISIGTRARA